MVLLHDMDIFKLDKELYADLMFSFNNKEV